MNKNCLAGYRCPKCDSYGPFIIETVAMTEWSDNGTDHSSNAEMKEGGACHCTECEHFALTSDFNIVHRYVEDGGTYCPVCRSQDIAGQEVVIDGAQATQEMGCQECSAVWTAVYKLTDVIIREEE